MKSADEAKANLQASVAYIPKRYTDGIARSEWQRAALSDQAEANYATGVNKAIAEKSRQAGIGKVSNSDWQEAAITKGGAVIGQRIADSVDKQSAAWTPIYHKVQTAVVALKPRTTDWRQNVTNRVVGTVEAWKKAAGKS